MQLFKAGEDLELGGVWQPPCAAADSATGFTTAHRRLIQIAGVFVVLVRDMVYTNASDGFQTLILKRLWSVVRGNQLSLFS